jgi:hypothetical protein
MAADDQSRRHLSAGCVSESAEFWHQRRRVIDCTISARCFEGAGDPGRLEQIIGIFRKWVETASQEHP